MSKISSHDNTILLVVYRSGWKRASDIEITLNNLGEGALPSISHYMQPEASLYTSPLLT